jgi:aryl-alcohol dehydrogenase-like predicted oxidoreductase
VKAVLDSGFKFSSGSLAPYFKTWSEQLSGYHKLANDSNSSILDFSLSFVYNQTSVKRMVVGLNSVEQLREIVSSKKAF